MFAIILIFDYTGSLVGDIAKETISVRVDQIGMLLYKLMQ